MLSIGKINLEVGNRINLPENWHEKILKFNKMSSYPYEFIITEIVKEKNEKYCLCKAEKKGKTFKLLLTTYVAKYCIAQEVPDSNMGLSFKEYLPLENTKLLITNDRNPSKVVPANFEITVELVELNEETLICMDFQLNFLNGTGFTKIKYYCEGSQKSTWKFLLDEDVSYMTDYEKEFRDTLIHKNYVVASCEKMARYLEKEGATEHAKMLRERGKIHDNSKISCEDELYALSRIINDKNSLKDSSQQLSPIKLDAIKLHWKHNSHHPEHFATPIDMSRLDIMEMCCDWHARSTQYKTPFLEFVKKRQENRFHFPDWMFAEIWHYCQVLASEI